MQNSGFFKNDLEILNLMKEESNLTFSIVSFDATLKIKPQDLLKREHELYFDYSEFSDINESQPTIRQTIIKVNQNLFVYFNIINDEIKIKLFYNPKNVSDLNLFIMGLKKIVKNNENK